MTNIVVLIKQVPDTWSERKLTDGDFTLDREAADAVLGAPSAPPRRSARRCRWVPTRPST
ncbi:electron transfer flavoprotein subunit beta [Mycobacterium tuberculosis]|nr:electron transfer flavoprotein subunit beta [Mycobacterium tuberculosis]